MKILAIQNKMGIGDMIIYLPFLEAIAKKYNTKVDILVKANSKAKEILKFNNYVGEIINLDRNNKNKKRSKNTKVFKSPNASPKG